ncbi:MAG: c-type cytochrome [Methylophilaceae bacterium]
MRIDKLFVTRIVLVLASCLSGATAMAGSRSASSNYILRCAGCHGMDGSGSSIGGIPSLGLIKSFTSDAEGRMYVMHVPGVVNSSLSNQEIADVVNYAVEKWGAKDVPFQHFSLEEVTRLRASNIDDIVSYRRNLTARYLTEGKLVAEYPWP